MSKGKLLHRPSEGWYAFFCPGCQNVHQVNSGWTFNGDYDAPTFTPSVLVNGNPKYKHPTAPRCHSFVTDGQIRFLDDCEHDLKGQTVPLQRFDDIGAMIRASRD